MTDYNNYDTWNGQWKCPNCDSTDLEYDDEETDEDRRFTYYKCNRCGTEIIFIEIYEPSEVEYTDREIDEDEIEEDEVESGEDEEHDQRMLSPAQDFNALEIYNMAHSYRQTQAEINRTSNLSSLDRRSIGLTSANLRAELEERLEDVKIKLPDLLRRTQQQGHCFSQEAIDRAIERRQRELKVQYADYIRELEEAEAHETQVSYEESVSSRRPSTEPVGVERANILINAASHQLQGKDWTRIADALRQ